MKNGFFTSFITFYYALNDTNNHINITDRVHKTIVILNTCQFFWSAILFGNKTSLYLRYQRNVNC
jgi:hypothetical protein